MIAAVAHVDDREGWRRNVHGLAEWTRGLSGASEGAYVIEQDGVVASVMPAVPNGLATALMAHALADARERGCTTSTLQATDLGRPVYERLGYRSLGEIQMWERRRGG